MTGAEPPEPELDVLAPELLPDEPVTPELLDPELEPELLGPLPPLLEDVTPELLLLDAEDPELEPVPPEVEPDEASSSVELAASSEGPAPLLLDELVDVISVSGLGTLVVPPYGPPSGAPSPPQPAQPNIADAATMSGVAR